MTTIEFWIQPKKNSKKYYFKHQTDEQIQTIGQAEDEIQSFSSETYTQAMSTRTEITKPSAIQKAMQELYIESNWDYGVVKFYCS